MVKLETILGPRVNTYMVIIDGQKWCETISDDDGLKLAIAVAKCEARTRAVDLLKGAREVNS